MVGKFHSPPQRVLDVYGLTAGEWIHFRDMGLDAIGEGYARSQTPLVAFSKQKRRAKNRGIDWGLSFLQWWGIWQASGKWGQRGRGQGYCMSRCGDVGPYAVGNVYINTVRSNSRDATRKDALPIGAFKTRYGFTSKRQIDGKLMRLGTFSTAQEAHDAYLKAGSL